MTMRIPLSCRCGAVRGCMADVANDGRRRAICYCDDCQIYALHLGRSDVLDERGGTDSLVVAPAQLTLEQGAAHVRCLRLSPKGPYRWYAGCCNTPLGNTLKPGIPFVIVLRAAIDERALATSPERALGPVAFRIHGRFARGGVPEGAHPKVPPRLFVAFAGYFVSGVLAGRARPHPFFDERGAPCAEPQILDRSRRETLRAQVHAAVRA